MHQWFPALTQKTLWNAMLDIGRAPHHKVQINSHCHPIRKGFIWSNFDNICMQSPVLARSNGTNVWHMKGLLYALLLRLSLHCQSLSLSFSFSLFLFTISSFLASGLTCISSFFNAMVCHLFQK